MTIPFDALPRIDPAYAPAIIAAMAALVLILGGIGLAMEHRAARARRLAARVANYCSDDSEHADARSLLEKLREDGAKALQPVIAAISATFFARDSDRVKARRTLRRGGFSQDNALALLAASKATAAFLGAVAAVRFVLPALLPEASLPTTAFLGLGGAIGGSLFPEILLNMRVSARVASLRGALPDAIDLMVISAHAGHSLDMSLDRVARELPRFAPGLATEFSLLNAELQVLPDRTQAFRNFSERNDISELSAFANTLIQTIRYGAPFATSLRALAADLRQSRLLAAEEKAAKLPAMLTLPLILFIMPPVFIVVAGPAILSLGDMFGGQ